MHFDGSLMGSAAGLRWTTRRGICFPSDGNTSLAFQNVQKQLNGLLKARGLATIKVDGKIGPATVAAATKVWAKYKDCDDLSRNAANVTGIMAMITGVKPLKEPSPPGSVKPHKHHHHPSHQLETAIVSPSMQPEGGIPWLLIGGIGLGVGALFLLTEKKPKRKRTTAATAAATA